MNYTTQYTEKQTGLIWHPTWIDVCIDEYYLQTQEEPYQYWVGNLNELNSLFEEKKKKN